MVGLRPRRSRLKVVVEESVEVLYLVIELVLTEIGFSARRGFTATTAHTAAAITSIAAACKRERHTDDYRTQYRNPKSHLSIVWHKDNQNQGKQNKSCSTAGLVAILLTAGLSHHLRKFWRSALRDYNIDGRRDLTTVGSLRLDVEAVILRAVIAALGNRYGRAERELVIAAGSIEHRYIFFRYRHSLAILRQRGTLAIDISVLDEEARDFGRCLFYAGIAHAVTLDNRCIGLGRSHIGRRRVEAAASEGGKGYDRFAG